MITTRQRGCNDDTLLWLAVVCSKGLKRIQTRAVIHKDRKQLKRNIRISQSSGTNGNLMEGGNSARTLWGVLKYGQGECPASMRASSSHCVAPWPTRCGDERCAVLGGKKNRILTFCHGHPGGTPCVGPGQGWCSSFGTTPPGAAALPSPGVATLPSLSRGWLFL